MKTIKAIIASLAVITACLTSCQIKPLVSPLYNEKKVVTAKDGTEFIVGHYEEDFPNQELIVAVSCHDKVIFSYNFKGVLNDYNYRNDFVNNWYQIISEYSADAIRSYQFYWGVLYTMDEGETFTTVFKHEYRQKILEDAVFKSLFDGLKDEMPHYTADATAALPAKV